MDEWLSKLWQIHTMDYYSATKRNELLTHATAWMNLQGIMLSEKPNPKGCMLYDSIYKTFVK